MQILNIFHVLIAIALVALVLIQKGQGATAGASFGAGASATVFGSRGAGTFLTRFTWILAALFCAISLTMAVVVSRTVGVPDADLGVVGDTPAQAEEPPAPTPGEETSLGDEDQSDSGVPAFDEAPDGASSDLPRFEAPEGAGAIEGSEVVEEIEPAGGRAVEESEEGETDSDG